MRPSAHAITKPKPRVAANARLAASSMRKAGGMYMAVLRGQDRQRHRAAECLGRSAAEASPAAAAKITRDRTPGPPGRGGGDGSVCKRASSWARHIGAIAAAVKHSAPLRSPQIGKEVPQPGRALRAEIPELEQDRGPQEGGGEIGDLKRPVGHRKDAGDERHRR